LQGGTSKADSLPAHKDGLVLSRQSNDDNGLLLAVYLADRLGLSEATCNKNRPTCDTEVLLQYRARGKRLIIFFSEQILDKT